MCIAIYKPAHVPMPSDEILERCWDSNSDGAGMSYPCKSGIQIIKGFKSFDQFLAFTKSQPFDKCNVLLHFRIGTHGDTTGPKHTHPFPIGRTVEEMESTNIVVARALIHNGIMYEFGYDKAISDTMAFCRDVATEVLALRSLPAGKDMIESILGTNKIAVMEKNGDVETYGTWILDKGIYWSNSSYKWARYSSGVSSCDPRTWGTAGVAGKSATSGKYGGYTSRFDMEADLEADEGGYSERFLSNSLDMEEEVDSLPDDCQFWSEYIGELMIDMETMHATELELLREQAASLDIPEGTRIRPMGMTHYEFDTWVCYQFMTKRISLDQFVGYCENMSIPEVTVE